MTQIKKLLHFNEDNFNRQLNELNTFSKPVLQGLIDSYNKLNLPALTTEDLHRLVNEPQELVIDKMINGQPLTIAGIPVKRDKFFEIAEQPEGLKELLTLKSTNIGSNFSWPVSNFEINAGELRLKPQFVESLKEENKRYATSQKQLDIAEQVQNIANSLNTLSSLGVDFLQHDSNAAGKIVSKAIDNPNSDGRKKFTANPEFIMKYQEAAI